MPLHAARDDAPDFRRVFESLPGAYLVLDPTYRIVAASDDYARATRTTREALVGRGIFDAFPDNPENPTADGVRQLRASLDRVVLNRVRDTMAVQHYDIPRPEAEGGGFEERHWSPINTPVFRADGSLGWIIHRVEDVTEFVLLRERGKEMEAEIYRRAQEIQSANERLREAKAALERLVAERTAELAEANVALRQEMDQSAQLEEQMRQAQKLEAVGRLAGGVAHDFNNLLTIITGYAEVLMDAVPQEHPDHEFVVEIGKAAARAATLTRQLLAFSRQQVLEPKLLDLNEVVRQTDKMLSRLIGEDLLLSLSLADRLGRVKADPGQIDQVLMNLVVNARDAMPKGGRLTIETCNVELDTGYTQYHLEVEAGPYVMLAVSDTGVGMDPDTRGRIFEPFFTTKPAGTGTGLGLSTVFGIVKQSGGHIYVYSEPGQGSTFKIYLPVAKGEPPVAEPTVGPQAPSGTETLLLVEDDDAVRAVTRLALERSGYTVLEAASGREAIAMAEHHSGRIDLLISDVVMPEIGGREVAEAITEARPQTKVLYLSGYTDDAVVRHGILRAEVAFLQKPFTPAALARKVRKVLSTGVE
jgi:signal transduction histidine kinase